MKVMLNPKKIVLIPYISFGLKVELSGILELPCP